MRKKLKWLKEHKKEVLITAGVLAGTTMLIVIGVKSRKVCEDAIASNYAIDLEKLPIKELGNAGKRFLDAIPEATDDTLVNVVAYIEKKDLA